MHWHAGRIIPLVIALGPLWAADPAVIEAGDSEVIVGTGLESANVTKLDSPPPGAGFSTQT